MKKTAASNTHDEFPNTQLGIWNQYGSCGFTLGRDPRACKGQDRQHRCGGEKGPQKTVSPHKRLTAA